MAATRDPAEPGSAGPVGIGVRLVQRPHRAARQPRRRRTVRSARHLPERGSTRRVRCPMPRPDTAIPRPASRSSTSPTARSSGCWSTTSPSTSDTANCTTTSGSWTYGQAPSPARPLAITRRQAGAASCRRGLVSLAHRSMAAIEYVVEAVDEFVRADSAIRAASPTRTNRRRPATHGSSARADASPARRPSRGQATRARCWCTAPRGSGLMMAAAMDHEVEVPGRVDISSASLARIWACTTVICGLRPGAAAADRQVPRVRVVQSAIAAGAARSGLGGHRRAHATAGGRDCWTPNAPTSTSSGIAPMSRSRVTPIASKLSASACSTCCRPAPAPSAARSRARAHRHRL